MVDNVFILDEHLKVSKVLSIDGQNTFFDDLYISDLSSGTESYEFSTNVNDIEESNYVMFHYKGQYKLFQIVELEQEHNEGKIISTIYCECACLELLNNVVRPFSGEYSCIGFLQHVLEGTGWQIYKYTSTLTSKILSVNVNKSTQVWSCIQDYMHKYGYELNTRVEYSNGYVKAKIIEIYDEGELGEKTYKRFEYGRNVDGIVKKKDLYEWCTALILDTYKDITNVTYDKDGYVKKNGSDVILATNENEKYNLGRPYIYGSYEDNESISGQEVVEKGVEELKRRAVPHFDYECDTALTYKEYKELNIGDTVYVIDHTFSPSITLEARIGKLEISFTDRNNCKCNLTNYKEVKSKIGEDLSSITEQVKNNANNIEELFNNTTIVNSNGEVVLLKDEYNITKDTIDSHTQTIGNLQTTIDSATGEIVLLKENVNSTKDTLDSHTQTISSLQSAINGTLTDTVAEYYVSTSATSQTGGSWSTVSPTWQSGKYIWQRMKYTYSNGSTGYSTPVCIQGAKGEKGEDGTGINIIDKLTSTDQLPSTGNKGDAYTVNGVLYVWSEDVNNWIDCGNIKGEKGEDGVDGTSSYLHIKYSDDGRTFTANNGETVGAYIGVYTDSTAADSNNFEDYTWSRIRGDQGLQGVQGERGEQGIQGEAGKDGADGKTTYFHIKYSANANGNPMTEVPSEYIGTYVDYTAADSTDYTKYTWARFQGLQGERGEQGIPGTNGNDGQTYYLHIKYSNDGGKTFTSNNGETTGDYIGVYTDTTQADSTSASSYTWTKVKGDIGEKGQSLTKSTPQWYASTSNTTQTGGSWVESMPSIDNSHYLWLRYKLDWANPTATTYTTPTLEQIAENIKEVSKKQSQLEQNLEGFKTTVSETYASKNETSVIEQKIDKVEIDFNTSGGYNLLINSSGRGGLNNWISTDTSAFYTSTNVLSYPVIKHTESGGVFVGSNSNTSDKYLYSDRFSLCPNATYILYGKIYSSSGMIGSVHLLTSSSIANLEDTSLSYDNIYTCATSPSTGSWEEFSYTFTAPSNISSALIRLSHKCTVSGSTNEILFGDLCLIPGNRKRPWTPHPSELYEEKVAIDKTGVTVKNSNTNYCSNMNPSGLELYEEGNATPIAYFRTEGSYVDNLISNAIYCPSFPRYAHLFELKTDYYVNSTSSGDGLGGNASNCCSSIQQVIDTIKDCGTIIDKDVTIHILNGAAINENIIIGGFYGTGSITLAWEYQTRFYGTINIINNGIKIIYSGENDGSVAGRFVNTTTCAVNKEEAGNRHRIYSDTGVVPITVQNSYVEINNSIFIRSNFTKPSEITTDYSLNVKENGYVYLYGNDFVYNYAVGYVERTGKVVLDYNSGTTYYRFHGRERGHVSEGQYTFHAITVNELVEPFAILYDGGRMYSSDAYDRSSYYINQGYNTDPNYTPVTEGENTFRLSPEYEASPLRNLEVAYKHVGLVLGSDGNEVFQGSFFLEEKDYPKLFNVLKNKTIMSMRLSLTRVADSVNPDSRVDIYAYTHDASQYFDSNIAIRDTVSLNFSSSLINSLVLSARNNSYIKMRLLSNRTTLSDQTLTDYAAFNRNAVILYIEYGV